MRHDNIEPDFSNLGENTSPRNSQIEDITNDVKMVIWDLDDTFWKGTLAEGEIEFIQKHGELVKELASRGIISSIASKNDFNSAKEILERHGLWDYFVFPSISFEPKGKRVSQIIDNAALRPQNILFIDDNILNIEEVRFFNKDIMVADPRSFLPGILNHLRLAGSSDPELRRLKQYQLLQIKFLDQTWTKLSNEDFLRSSRIKIFFDFDANKNFDRIVELINRTNQLNYTKNRLETERDINEFRKTCCMNSISTACISCTDRYGDYGVIGFFMLKKNRGRASLIHFCFSCRTMNMGIEQFVYEYLKKPSIDIVPKVAYGLQSHENVDWIDPSHALDRAQTIFTKNKKLLFVGACEVEQLAVHCSSERVEFVAKTVPDQGLDYSIRYEDPSFFLTDRELLRTSEPMRKIHAWSYEDTLIFDRAASEAEIIILGMRGILRLAPYKSKNDNIFVLLSSANVDNYKAAHKVWFDDNFDAIQLTAQDRLARLKLALKKLDQLSLPNAKIFLLGAVTKLVFRGIILMHSILYNKFCEQFCKNHEKYHFVDSDKLVSKDHVLDEEHISHAGYSLLAGHINQIVSEKTAASIN